MATSTVPDAMMVDKINKEVSPTDLSYVESLEEPWKSIALRAIPPAGTIPLPSASSRLDRLELDVRSQLLKSFCTDSEGNSSTKNAELAGGQWKSTLNMCLHLVHHSVQSADAKGDTRYENMAARKLPLVLLEDCLDVLSVVECQQLWADYVEPALDQILLGNLFWDTSTVCHFQFLRVCNQFLRVLDTASHGDDHEWKGRILWALAKAFAITDRSALKVWGSFHTSNHNDFESQEEFEKDHPHQPQQQSHTPAMDYNLYHAFWALQEDFANPNRIQLAEFLKKMNRMLEALESSASSHSSPSDLPKSSSLKYMTSSLLLPTQLADPNFRSSVVAQFLIAASHLSSESPALANALAGLLTRAKKLLKADHPELYRILWESILAQREGKWRQWKKNKCPPANFAPKRKATDEQKKAKKRPKLSDGPLGSNEESPEHAYESLKRNELVQISQELKTAVPTLEQHMEPYVEALDPESGIEAEYHPQNDSLYTWRAMRLYTKHQLPLLKECRSPADLERMTRLWYKEQGKDIPGEMPPPDDVSEDEGGDDDDASAEDDSGAAEDDNAAADDDNSSTQSEGDKPDDVDGPAEDEEVNPKDLVEEGMENQAEPDNSAGESNMEEGNGAPDISQDDNQSSKGSENSVALSDAGNDNVEDKERVEKGTTPPDTEAQEKGDTTTANDMEMEKAGSGAAADSNSKPVEAETKQSAGRSEPEKDNRSRREDKGSASRGQSEEDDGEVVSGTRRGGDLKRKRERSRSPEREPPKVSRPPRADLPSRDSSAGHNRDPPGSRGKRHEDIPPQRGGRHDNGPPPRTRRREDGPPRGGRRDDGPPPPRGGRRDDRPPPRAGGRHEDGPPRSRGPQGRQDDNPPRGGGRGDRGRDDRPRGGGERRRGNRDGGRDSGRDGGRDEGRFRRHR